MKIVHIVYSLEMGGAEVLVAQLCRIQREQGHDVSVCVYSQLGVIGEALAAEGFDIRVMGVAHPLTSMRRYYKLFRQTKPDVVHCHNVAPTIQAALSARLAGVPRVLTTRHRVQIPYEVAEEVKYNLAYRPCYKVVGICEATCIDLRGAPLAQAKKVVRVYNGTTAVPRVSIDGLGKRGFTLVVVGRLAVVKDVGTLIRAVALALERVPELDLWIVGDGITRPQLEALTAELGIGDHVKFWGQQVNTAPFFSAADVFVMSSLSEGLPMSLLESMSLGIPAILTDVEGSGEMLRLSGGGLLVPVKDPAAYADAIVKMALDTELRAEFSKRALATYEAQFTLERMNAGYMELYSA
jgi:glycosyltransferase involved in cell wall biosynthesis